MEEEPLVSIGIPCYNRPEGLRKTLDSIIGQTYRNLEIIISDNCSPNIEVENIGKKYTEKDDRIRYIKQKTNIGALNNFCFLVENTSGEYFIWIAEDDWISQYYIEKCAEFLKNNIDYCVAVGTPRYMADDEQRSTFINRGGSFEQNRPSQRVLSTYLSTGLNLVAIYGVIVKKNLNKIPIKNVFGSDRHILASLAFLGKIKMLEDIYIVRRIGVSSGSPRESHNKICDGVGRHYYGIFFTRFRFALGASKNILSATKVFYKYPLYKKLFLSFCCFFASIIDTFYVYYIRHYSYYAPNICKKMYYRFINEPIPELRIISPNLEFGEINRSYDVENSFEIFINLEKNQFWNEFIKSKSNLSQYSSGV